MYVAQGILTVLIGAAIPLLLPNYVKDANWLTADEKTALQGKLDADDAQKKSTGATTIREGFLDPRVLLTTLTCFFLVCANFGTVLFLPQILRPAFPALNNVQISLLISLAFTTALSVAGRYLGAQVPQTFLQAAGSIVSFAVITAMFAIMFKLLPDTKVRWRDVWLGAALTAALFELGKMLIGVYVGRLALASTYGAAASLVIMLIWVYYSSQILLLGAEFTHCYAGRHRKA